VCRLCMEQKSVSFTDEVYADFAWSKSRLASRMKCMPTLHGAKVGPPFHGHMRSFASMRPRYTALPWA
ncbi:MAG: hypothetical protein MK188_02160, partial [Gammaproteobacteria bacterium]|nr:hypothetical protein [Gammaproteobacteria bacterium]